MQLRPSRKLSVIGAMKDIQDYKIAKSQADAAPDLVERAKLMLEHDKKALPLDLKLKKQKVAKGDQDVVEEERKSLVSYYTDAMKSAQWITEGETEEEQKDRFEYAKQQMIDLHEDHVTSAEPGATAGNLIGVWGPDSIKKLEMVASQLPKKIEKLNAGQTIVEEQPGGKWDPKYTAPFKATKDKSWKSTDKTGQEWISTLNEDGQVTTVKVEGITGKPTKPPGAGTGAERERATLKAKLPEFQRMAREDPNKLYKEKSIQMNDDGTIPIDAWGAPVVLPPAHKVLGKRSTVTAILQAGEHYDDAVELQKLLQDPKVASDFRAAAEGGYWDRTKGTWSNRIRHWARKAGIADDSNTATAIGRMQMMASIQRKKFLGSAVTVPELKSVTAWMPSAGDSYETMINKNKLVVVEGKEVFERFLDVYKDQANMSPFYDAFHMKRFSDTPSDSGIDMKSKADMLIQKYSKGQ